MTKPEVQELLHLIGDAEDAAASRYPQYTVQEKHSILESLIAAKVKGEEQNILLDHIDAAALLIAEEPINYEILQEHYQNMYYYVLQNMLTGET